ncbi:MAG: hypothetical protein ACI4DP_04805 [Candidatus Ornithomonoglobus sp.]
MKSRVSASVFSALIVLASTVFSGCSKVNSSSDSSSSSSKNSSLTTSFGTESTSDNRSSAPIVPEIPKGEPTVFIGLDGEPIYASEVTAIDGTDKTAAELTKTDYHTSVLCEGFQYFTEPSGVAYNNYQNSEMFDDILFTGKIPENKNECRKIKVGEEICGLKLVDAVTEFKIEDYADTPEPYYYDGYHFGTDSNKPLAQFEGSVTLEGFLGANSRNLYEPDGGLLCFTPTESKLPILGNKPEFCERTNYVGSEFAAFSEMQEIRCGYIQDLKCDCAGLDVGDMAFVRVTISNIKYYNSKSIVAEIENIEMLSDILYHDEDSI